MGLPRHYASKGSDPRDPYQPESVLGEYDRLGFGRIEILTRPGSDKWRGGFNSNLTMKV
jgi:hypothetical protein